MRPYVFALLAIAACVNCGTARAIDLLVIPSSTAAPVGITVPVVLVVSGLGDSAVPSVGIFDLDLSVDASVLNLLDAMYGSQLDVFDRGSIQETLAGAGTINLFDLSLGAPDDLDSLQPGSFTLATPISR